jgi:hypothetical protein
VVESSLDVPTDYTGKLRWQTTGMFNEAMMAEPWGCMGEAAMAESIRHKRGLLGSQTSVVMLQARGNH